MKKVAVLRYFSMMYIRDRGKFERKIRSRDISESFIHKIVIDILAIKKLYSPRAFKHDLMESKSLNHE